MTSHSDSNGKPASANTKANSPGSAVAGSGKSPAVATSPAVQAGHPQPKTWGDIKVGSLVIAHESHDDGWWEAIVTEVTGDVLTLRWRDYPRQPVVARTRDQVALLFPGK